MVVPIRWDVETADKREQLKQPGPGKGPPEHLLVPNPLHSEVLQSCFSPFWTPGDYENMQAHPEEVLVAWTTEGHPRICCRLFGLWPEQKAKDPPSWPAASAAHSNSPLVSNFHGLHHRLASVSRKYGNPSSCRQIFKSLSPPSFAQAPYNQPNSGTVDETCVQDPWFSTGYGF